MTSRPVPCFPSRRATLLAAAVISGAIACTPAAHAARMTIAGENLDLTIPCTGEVRVKVDPNMKDGATLDSSSLTQVAMHASKEDAESKISLATKACSPNGRLAITVSANTGVTIHDSHDTHFIITGQLASLDASLDSTTMEIDDTQSLDLRMQGASSVHIKSLERAAQVVASGTSTLTADTVQLAALSAQLTQDATMTLSGGSIDALTLVTADRAGATILSQATVATVAANGAGTVNIQSVTGPMVRSGTGTVRVGAPNGVIYRPTPVPPATPVVPSAPAETSATPPVAVAAPNTPIPTPSPVAPIAPSEPIAASTIPQTSVTVAPSTSNTETGNGTSASQAVPQQTATPSITTSAADPTGITSPTAPKDVTTPSTSPAATAQQSASVVTAPQTQTPQIAPPQSSASKTTALKTSTTTTPSPNAAGSQGE